MLGKQWFKRDGHSQADITNAPHAATNELTNYPNRGQAVAVPDLPILSDDDSKKSEITDEEEGRLHGQAIWQEGEAANKIDVKTTKDEIVAPRPGDDFPDGGLQAWTCCLGGWLTLFCSFGFMNAIGVFQAYYKSDLLPTYSESTLSWISGCQLFFIFAGSSLAGTFFDTFGPRYLSVGAAIIMPFGMMMISISTKYWQVFLSQAVVVAFGICIAFNAAVNSVSTWFFKRRGFAIGITSTGGSVGGIFYPIVMSKMLPKVGFGWTIRCMGFLNLTFLIIACFLVKSRLHHAMSLKGRKLVLFDFPALKEPAWALFCLGALVQILGLWGPVNYLSIFSLTRGFSKSMAFNLIAILNAGSFAGRILPGFLGDKFGRITMFTIFSMLSGLLIMCMWSQIHTHVTIILFAAFYGFSSGAFLSSYPPCVAQLSDIRKIGQRLGSVNFICAISSLASLPIHGALIKGHDDFHALIYFAGAMMIIGSVILIVCRYYAGGKKWRVYV